MVVVLALGLLIARTATAEALSPADAMRALLEAPEGEFDFARAKLAVDRLIDPNIDANHVLAEIDHMVATINKMLATLPPQEASTSVAKLKALQSFLYRSGQWNGGRQFHYDMDDPLGQNPAHMLLVHYLATREGNCVSMPILFVILGERLGLDVTLSAAPLHVLVKYTHSDGVTYNLEATSGAGFTRDDWYRRNMPMTDEAIANGVYLKVLSRREAYAVIATSAVEYLLDARRYEEAIALADVILDAYPANAHALVKKGTGYYRVLQRDIISKYPNPSDTPPDAVNYANTLYRANQEAFASAEALGWREPTSLSSTGLIK